MGAGEACGKVILLGEHAVVYGVPAIAVGITRGARARATSLAEGPSRLRVTGWEVTVTDAEPENDVARAFAALVGVARSDEPSLSPVAVDIEVELPPGGGLGCSAAMGVAIARAVGRRPSEEAVQARAMAWERVFHGNPSGVDAAVAAQGGCLFFRKGEDGTLSRRGHHLIESVRVRGPLHLCVGHTGCASSTKAMVEGVARMKARRPDVVGKCFEAIRSLVANARLAVRGRGPRFALGRLLDLNQNDSSVASSSRRRTSSASASWPGARGLSARSSRERGAAGAWWRSSRRRRSVMRSSPRGRPMASTGLRPSSLRTSAPAPMESESAP